MTRVKESVGEYAGSKTPTGIPGFDEIIGGGLPSDAFYLLQGDPGVGKTTFGLQFLIEGLRRGEKVLYATFSETRAEVESVIRAHGWPAEGLVLYEFAATEAQRRREADQTMFHPAEVELEEAIQPLFAEVERLQPARLVIDSLSEIRLLSREPLRYRRQLLGLKQFFLERSCTALLIDERPRQRQDDISLSLAHGVILLEMRAAEYGATRRRLMVEKLRGVGYSEGYHDYRIRTGGIVVYPRIVAKDHPRTGRLEPCPSGVPDLDTLLGGGIDRGTSTLITGAAGTGKSSLAAQYALAAVARGESAAVYIFEESLATWTARAAALNPEARSLLASGRLTVSAIDPAELSVGELSWRVREHVEQKQARILVIDSLNGYLQSVPEERFLLLHLHELLTYLGNRGVSTILTLAQHGLFGPTTNAPLDVSYLADNVLLLRYFEAEGAVRQAISVVKKRSGRHERTIREFSLDGGIRVGEPLREFQGVLTGEPTYRGGHLLSSRDAADRP